MMTIKDKRKRTYSVPAYVAEYKRWNEHGSSQHCKIVLESQDNCFRYTINGTERTQSKRRKQKEPAKKRINDDNNNNINYKDEY